MKKIKKVAKKVSNYIKSVPTRLRARKEYNNNVYEYQKSGGDLMRIKRKKPLATYNKASTGIRKKAK